MAMDCIFPLHLLIKDIILMILSRDKALLSAVMEIVMMDSSYQIKSVGTPHIMIITIILFIKDNTKRAN